jgi:DedD protein
MSFFNLRRGGSSSQTQSGAPAENLDTVRKRAKHRLIGAAVLVLVGVVGFPLLFDSQPRPIPVDIAIEIPARQSVKPLATATPASATPAPSAAPATPAPDPAPVAPPVAPPAAVASVTPAVTPVPAVPSVPAAAAPRAAEDSARAKALLEDKPVVAANESAELRLVVQVGAFADAAKAREVRLKLEKAGLKTYTQVADSKEGKRTRVRVGPFASKAEADQAALKIKALDLPATILSL